MRAGGGVGRVILDLEGLALARGIVRDDKLHRMQHAHRALGGGIEVLAQAVLEEGVLHHARALGDTDAVAEIADGLRREAAAAQAAERRHPRIVPAGDDALLHELAQLALAHHRVVDAETGKLDLARLAGHGDVVHHPVVERTVRLKLQRAERVRDALERVLNGMGEVVHRVDAPLVALTVMVHIADAVDDRIAHIEVTGGQVDLRAQRAAALGELAVLHALKEVEVLLHVAVAVGGDGGLADVAAVLLRLLGRQVADVGKALLDQLDGVLIVLFKVIAAVEEAVAPVEAQPMDILLDGVDKLDVLLGGVGIVHTKIAQAAEALGGAEVDGQRLAVADVQIAVRLRRKTGVDLLTLEATTLRNILFDKGVNKVLAFALGDGGLDFLSHTESFLSSRLPAASKIMFDYSPFIPCLQQFYCIPRQVLRASSAYQARRAAPRWTDAPAAPARAAARRASLCSPHRSSRGQEGPRV